MTRPEPTHPEPTRVAPTHPGAGPAPAPILYLEASPGEVFDRRSIDRLKAERLADPEARGRAAARVRRHDALLAPLTAGAAVGWGDLAAALAAVNARLWALETAVRALGPGPEHDTDLAACAREIHRLNDRRAALKRALDGAFGAAPGEDKGHPDAQQP